MVDRGHFRVDRCVRWRVSGRYRSGVARASPSRVRSCDGEQREDGGVINGDRHRPSSVFVVGTYRVAPGGVLAAGFFVGGWCGAQVAVKVAR